jgi:stage V sporulation protein D (sporulation-specific penicillin-binding protein)
MWRATVIFSLILGAFLLVILRLFYWQIWSGDTLKKQASAQYNLEFTLPASRGPILTQDASPLVLSVSSNLVYALPKEIDDKSEFLKKLSTVLSFDGTTVKTELSVENRIWVPIAKRVDTDTADRIRALTLKGLGFENTSKRFYPEASTAAHFLGFVGLDQYGNDKGYFGLEGYYDRQLRGKDGYIQTEKDVRGAPIPFGEAKRIEPEDGSTLTLWIDRTIQRIAEQRLNEGIAKYGAKEGSVVIMDPKTGGILAMASYPSYDPLKYDTFDKTLYKNPIVAGSFEPGSTFKIFVMAAALSERAVKATTTMDENGPVQVGEYSIKTWNDQYHGIQTMTEIIQHSSNVGMVFVGKELGKERLLSYIRKFGLGKETGVDLEDEFSPELRPDNLWTDIDLSTATFGQGIAVTPLQMVRAAGSIANDGILMEPHMVRKFTDARGKVIEIKPKRISEVITKEASDIMTEMMINAVDNGEAKWAKPKGYRIAGKTGTAQIPVSGHYDDKKTIASFVGFAPADDPLFVMLVTLREPSSSQWGSETAAPLFFRIAEDIFLYKGIAPKL